MLFSQCTASVLLFFEEQAGNNLSLGSYWTLNSVTSRHCSEWVCACERERVFKCGHASMRLPPAHTLPLLLFCSRQTVALETQLAPVCWKWEKNAALFIYLSNFFSSFLSKGRAYAPLSSGGRYWNDFRCDKIRTLLICFFLFAFCKSNNWSSFSRPALHFHLDSIMADCMKTKIYNKPKIITEPQCQKQTEQHNLSRH